VRGGRRTGRKIWEGGREGGRGNTISTLLPCQDEIQKLHQGVANGIHEYEGKLLSSESSQSTVSALSAGCWYNFMTVISWF
jgi:hypothetical protein